ncbi:2-octaprenyl-3-methyl-6-methoxy-1,4-benzoquinol hydroxylase [Shewanella fodinae]|uniref:2-octaprenyl-3-methyl-6-methoxy-1,4-benzoquinol hydroxylase n=2 Tax=Shewanella fodinae TaxID=552357 RepID=A0A4R2F7G8_9GAMM|nr:FAD-dependent monooxygenase [Shewanella fodinae]TCN82050.1 2-octaprenyl-3-methyl-6-methoxy-1,4-benzoquinol hydroxylase [Shewanella fodinae]
MTKQHQQQDIVIIGGGMVGAAAAVGLAQLGLRVAVVEACAPEAYDPEQALDVRVSAVSLASENLLARLGALEGLLQMRQVAYRGLETWEMDGCITRFHAEQLKLSHLGHIVENRLVQLALWQQFERYDKLTVCCPAQVTRMVRSCSGIEVSLDNGLVLDSHLLVGADGANSLVRQWAGIGVAGWDYSQSCMLINIATADDEQDITWQQFTPRGPRSLLPLPGHHASLVWYDDAKMIKGLMQLSPKQLKQAIDSHFPERLNRDFEVLERGSFPLTRRHAKQYYRDNLVLLGDAAHTINPLAGQGVNLGFKDVDTLLEEVASALSDNPVQWWDNAVLARYQRRRWYDNQLMMTGMDLFYAGFSNDILPLKLVRNLGLKLADINTPVKQQVLRYALGLS